MPTIRSFKTKLQASIGVLLAAILLAGIFGYRALHSTARPAASGAAEPAALGAILAALAIAAGLALFVKQALDAIVHALDLMAGYAHRIGEGEVPEKITGSFHGDSSQAGVL